MPRPATNLLLLLSTLPNAQPPAPLALIHVQAVVAWLGVAVQYHGQPIERLPRSLLGYFFATYWEGSPEQCGTAAAAGAPGAAADVASLQAPAGGSAVSLAAAGGPDAAAAAGGCTLCCFPAAAVIAHAVFTLAFLAALWVTCARLAAAVLNNRLKRRMRLFQLAYSALAVGGAWQTCCAEGALLHAQYSGHQAGGWRMLQLKSRPVQQRQANGRLCECVHTPS